MTKVIKVMVLSLLFFLSLFKIAEWSQRGKIAIKESDFDQYDQYILVKETYHTGTGWEVIGDNNGYYNKYRDIIVLGNLPEASHPTAVNIFLCKVDFIEPRTFIDGNKYEAIQIQDWFPVYPVVRNRCFFPKCLYSKKFLRKDEYVNY